MGKKMGEERCCSAACWTPGDGQSLGPKELSLLVLSNLGVTSVFNTAPTRILTTVSDALDLDGDGAPC